MTILVIAEHDHVSVKSATLNAIAAAKKIGGGIDVLVAGNDCAAAARAVAMIDGVARVRVADAAHYADQPAENVAALVAAMLTGIATSWRRPLPSARTCCQGLLHCWMWRRSPTSWKWCRATLSYDRFTPAMRWPPSNPATQ